MLHYLLCLLLRGKKEQSCHQLYIVISFYLPRQRKIWRMLLFFYPYKILIKNFVHMYRQTIEKEEFCCHSFLFSHLERTQECLKCLSHISYKKKVFLSSLQGREKDNKLVFRINYVKSYCGKRKLFSIATALLP